MGASLGNKTVEVILICMLLGNIKEGIIGSRRVPLPGSFLASKLNNITIAAFKSHTDQAQSDGCDSDFFFFLIAEHIRISIPV